MKTKYELFDKNSIKWQMVYCTNDSLGIPDMKSIAKSMLMGNYFKEFNKDEFECINKNDIKNGENIFIVNEDDKKYLWQLGSRVADMTGVLIPHLYYVRKIGIII